ncbi:MAG: hypothetical protein U1D68_03825 [Arthrobacter sp.]|nr:hypothetical protein [Arthrobacter sp.]MDZ4352873.1 hypothetical protein [Arthrobacter sp.]
MAKLHVLKVQEQGSVSIGMPEMVLSERADQALADAPGIAGRRRA